ncbi:MAG TPA: thermonuclease family protein [Thermoguttaceae bacterium]
MKMRFIYYFVKKEGLNEIAITDGDTIDAIIDQGRGILGLAKIRIEAVDSPESSIAEQAAAAAVAKKVLAHWLAKHDLKTLRIVSNSLDKYGRILGDVEVVDKEGITTEKCSEFLLAFGCVRLYHGEAKLPWIREELAKIESLAALAEAI